MTQRGGAILARIGILMALTFMAFGMLQARARSVETAAATRVLAALGLHGIRLVSGSSVVVAPVGHRGFVAIVTPSCSSLAPVLALTCLATLAPAYAGLRKVAAGAAAVSTVVVGNVLRIAASLAVGLVAGRSSLVLFHDSVGNIFSFGYILGGYLLMLWLLLPNGRDPSGAVVHAWH